MLSWRHASCIAFDSSDAVEGRCAGYAEGSSPLWTLGRWRSRGRCTRACSSSAGDFEIALLGLCVLGEPLVSGGNFQHDPPAEGVIHLVARAFAAASRFLLTSHHHGLPPAPVLICSASIGRSSKKRKRGHAVVKRLPFEQSVGGPLYTSSRSDEATVWHRSRAPVLMPLWR
jgi:hypothetical protein